MDKAELAKRVKEVAYLEGDFLLRSGRRSEYYLDKYLFETQPGILAELGRRLADREGLGWIGSPGQSSARCLWLRPLACPVASLM